MMLVWLTSVMLAPASLAPASRWLVDFAEQQCVATRTYGSGEDQILFVIKPSPTSDVVQLMAVKKAPYVRPVQQDALLTLGGSAPIKVKQLKYASDGKSFRLINLAAEQAGMLETAQTIEWTVDGSGWTLETGSIAQLMKTLATCRADLRDHWNISPEKSASLKSPATSKRHVLSYFSSDDYPAQAVGQGEGGTASVVALIDEKGVVQDCMIDSTSGVPTLDAMTCAVIFKRMKFQPGIDKDGKPVRSFVMQRVRWEMP
jgi:TonB family protein